jgi:hypothetical protein
LTLGCPTCQLSLGQKFFRQNSNLWKKKKDFSFAGRFPPRRPSPRCEDGPAPPTHHCPWTLVPLWPHRLGTVVSALAHLSGFSSPKPPPLLCVCRRLPANPPLLCSIPLPGASHHCWSSCRLTCARCSTNLSPPKLRCRLALLCQLPWLLCHPDARSQGLDDKPRSAAAACALSSSIA